MNYFKIENYDSGKLYEDQIDSCYLPELDKLIIIKKDNDYLVGKIKRVDGLSKPVFVSNGDVVSFGLKGFNNSWWSYITVPLEDNKKKITKNMLLIRESRIINGTPRTDGDEELLSSLNINEKEQVLNWISRNLYERKTPNYHHSSYGLKHLLEHDIGIYLTNNQFKHAMILLKYYPVNENDLNWYYCISERSPAFHKK